MKVIAFLVCAILLSSASPPEVKAAEPCGGWWNPCCAWYMPWRCSAIPESKKATAADKEYWYTNAAIGLGALAGLLGMLGEDADLATGTAIVGTAVAASLAIDQNKIRSAAEAPPPPKGPDPAVYWTESYPWPSPQEIGVSDYSGWYWTDNLIVGAQGARQMANMVENEQHRFRACVEANDDCQYDAKARVDWALYVHGWYLGYIGEFAENLAYIVAANVPDHRGLVGLLIDVANISYDAEVRYQQ